MHRQAFWGVGGGVGRNRYFPKVHGPQGRARDGASGRSIGEDEDGAPPPPPVPMEQTFPEHMCIYRSGHGGGVVWVARGGGVWEESGVVMCLDRQVWRVFGGTVH